MRDVCILQFLIAESKVPVLHVTEAADAVQQVAMRDIGDANIFTGRKSLLQLAVLDLRLCTVEENGISRFIRYRPLQCDVVAEPGQLIVVFAFLALDPDAGILRQDPAGRLEKCR